MRKQGYFFKTPGWSTVADFLNSLMINCGGGIDLLSFFFGEDDVPENITSGFVCSFLLTQITSGLFVLFPSGTSRLRVFCSICGPNFSLSQEMELFQNFPTVRHFHTQILYCGQPQTVQPAQRSFFESGYAISAFIGIQAVLLVDLSPSYYQGFQNRGDKNSNKPRVSLRERENIFRADLSP